MHALAVRLCLFGVLAAPLLCQAEAADALASSLAELVAPNVIEPSNADDDGACVAVLDRTALGSHISVSPVWTPALPPLPFARGLALLATPRTPSRSAPDFTPTRLRQADLQVFLF